MWREAIQFNQPAPSARVSDGGVIECPRGLDQTDEVRWHGDRVKRSLDATLAALGLFLSSPAWLLRSHSSWPS